MEKVYMIWYLSFSVFLRFILGQGDKMKFCVPPFVAVSGFWRESLFSRTIRTPFSVYLGLSGEFVFTFQGCILYVARAARYFCNRDFTRLRASRCNVESSKFVKR